jgi:hypothetical protein
MGSTFTNEISWKLHKKNYGTEIRSTNKSLFVTFNTILKISHLSKIF